MRGLLEEPDGGNPGTVTNVTGVLNRITVTNGATIPVVDISANYVGQTSITTLGTITAGTIPAPRISAGIFGTGAYTMDTSLTNPLLIGGASTTSSLTIQSTSNAGHTTGADIIFKSGAIEIGRMYDNGKVVFGPTATTKNAMVYDPNATNGIGDVAGLLGLYDPGNALYYGISRSLPSPTGTATAGGYYKGLGIGGATSGAGNPIFGVLNSTESGNGIGSVSLTVYDTTKIVTRHSTLDDGNGRMGINLATVTAFLHLPAGSAGANNAPQKFTSGISLTSPEAGAFEFDGNKLWITNSSLSRESLVGVLFTQTADKTVTNTLTETSIIGTGVGYGLTLPTNFWVAGKTIRIIVSGVYSTVAVTGDTVTIKVKYGTTVIGSTATTSLLAGATNLYFWAECLITCRSVGATGTVQISGGTTYNISTVGGLAEDPMNNGASPATIDTTISALLDVTVTHSAANASNTVKSLVSTFEVLN